MKLLTGARLAWLLWTFTALLTILALWLLLTNNQSQGRYDWPRLLSDGAYVLDALVLGLVGVFVAARQGRNAIGWLLLGAGLAGAGENFCQQYAVNAFIIRPGVLPGGIIPLWLSQWLWILLIMAFFLIALLFPTGKFTAVGWRWLGNTIIVGVFIIICFCAFYSELTFTDPYQNTIANPVGLFDDRHLNVDWAIRIIVIYGSITSLATVFALGQRFYSARGIERQQMKWVTYAMILSALAQLSLENSGLGSPWSGLLENLLGLAVPVALGMAILRYRLYDIDIIIRRTLVYSVLTGLLVLVYFGSVVLFQQLMRVGVGAGETPLVTVASTLAIARCSHRYAGASRK
ncbi:MAG: hypothetical protein U0350_06555 [Caldilineaceae bacterium]